MKGKILATSTLIATLLGGAQFVKADGISIFTPIDELDPDSRIDVQARINELTREMNIDWSTVIIGIATSEDGKNEVCIRTRQEFQVKTTGGFSCTAPSK